MLAFPSFACGRRRAAASGHLVASVHRSQGRATLTDMQAVKAQVRNGRIVVDEPTDLPDGKELSLVVVDDDGLSDGDRQQLLKMIDESHADEEAGNVEDFSSVIAELRSRL